MAAITNITIVAGVLAIIWMGGSFDFIFDNPIAIIFIIILIVLLAGGKKK